MIVLLGSTRPAKVHAVRDALQAMAGVDARFAAADLRPIAVDGVAPRMPMREAEILEGARARALAVAARAPAGDAWFALGLEGGLDPVATPDGTREALRSWACATDGRTWSYGAGGALLVPADIVHAVRTGRELGEVIDERAGAAVRGTRGAWGVLTRDLVSRTDAFRVAVIAAFAPFYNPGAFAGRALGPGR